MTVSPQATQRRRKPHWSLARTWLLQPGIPDGGEAYDAAIASSADAIVLDIEDGLPEAQKPAGRVAVAEWLSAGAQAWVRINSVATSAWSADLDAVARTYPHHRVLLFSFELEQRKAHFLEQLNGDRAWDTEESVSPYLPEHALEQLVECLMPLRVYLEQK